MKKILIIGAKGMLGQELVRVFGADNNYEVFGWDFKDINITDKLQSKEKIDELKPDMIINSAAYNAVDKCEDATEFEVAKKVNGLAPGFLAEIAKNLGATLVHYSSDYVFDGEKKDGYKEEDEPRPVSKYGETKLMGEQAVKNIGGNFYIIRLQKLFGKPAQSQNAKKSFFETMLALTETKKELEVVDEELANFTFAPDLSAQTKYLIESGLPFGIYHVTNEGAPATWFGAVKILFEIKGKEGIVIKPVNSDRFPRPAKRPKYSILINTKLPPLRSWPESLREF